MFIKRDKGKTGVILEVIPKWIGLANNYREFLVAYRTVVNFII